MIDTLLGFMALGLMFMLPVLTVVAIYGLVIVLRVACSILITWNEDKILGKDDPLTEDSIREILKRQ